MKALQKLEQSTCKQCSSYACNITDDLRNLINLMRLVSNHLKQYKVSLFYLKINEYFIEEFESKLENYSIASDSEIKNLLHELNFKLS